MAKITHYEAFACPSWILVNIDLHNPVDLAACLGELLAQVPSGRVTTYGDLARGLGDVVASRWVGHFLLHSRGAATWPAHRVVRSDGTLGLYAHGDAAAKARALAAEGVELCDGRVNLKQFGFAQFHGSRPLQQLFRLQQQLTQQVSLSDEAGGVALAGGVDVSYHSENRGTAAFALVEVGSGELVWSTTIEREVRFPYISSYLAFRELPLLLEVLQVANEKKQLADVVLVDGAGIMHPRRSGIASHLGIATGLPTIGVTKKLLAGKVAGGEDMPALQSRDVADGDDILGAAIRPRAASKKLIYVSPGHKMSAGAAVAITRQLLCGRRLPEPIYWADRLSRQAVSE